MTSIDPQALSAILARLDSESATTTLEQSLEQIVRTVVAVFGVSGSGLMILDEDSVLRYAAASSEPGRILESAQEELGHGPCVDAHVHDEHVLSDDLEAEERWDGLPERVTPVGVRAVLGVPVHLQGGAVGFLDVYRDHAHHWTKEEVAALTAFGAFVEGVIGGAVLAHRRGRLVEQLQYALDHRVVIERAVGVVMGRENLDAVDAFNSLRALARNRRQKVSVVAQQLLHEVRSGAQAPRSAPE